MGSHIALAFLRDGTYNIIGTVRDTKNWVKLEPLRKAFGDLFENLTLVEADLNDVQSIFAAIRGANLVVHTASPFPIGFTGHEDELIKPAVNGTVSVLKACQANKVTRVVITSSNAAIEACTPCYRPADGIFSEKNWSNPDGDNLDAYYKSKTLAELAAWQF